MGLDTTGRERALILAPLGRDAQVAAAILGEAGVRSHVCQDLAELCREMDHGAGLAMVTEEALKHVDLAPLVERVSAQEPWSDFPFVLLTARGGGVERNPTAMRLSTALGNVGFLERPFHPTTLVSIAKTALRGRRRQYEARARIEEIRRAEERLEVRVEERTAELAAANRQLAAQIGERERAEAALRQAQRLEAIGQLTSGVAHDFNNLLTVILGNIAQLKRVEPEPTAKRRLSMMAEAAERGARLTAQLLAFSRRQKLEPKPVDLNDTVSRMRDLLQSTMGGSVHIETKLRPGLWTAMIDPTQIELVILNLAINARDAMEVGGALTVETANVELGQPARPEDPPAGDYVMVAVSDTGPGMSPEVKARAFEPFFTTKDVGKGSGLGLSQVLGLAQQSGGGVRIDTELGKGASVKLYLPRSHVGAGAEPDVVASAPHAPRTSELVLVVDDDDAVREVTTAMLRDIGYRVVEAGSGGAALDCLSDNPTVQLMVVDFAMPGMNGAEVAREARARRSGLPVLYVTGFADTSALAEACEHEILLKPFNEDDLARKIGVLLGVDEPSSASNVVPLRSPHA